LVEILPQRGSFITPIRLHEVLEARFIREALEIAVVREAAASGRAEVLGRLENLLQAQRAAARDKDLERFLELDEAFHHTLSESVDKQRCWRLIQSVKHQLDRVRYLSLPEPGNLALLIRQHAAIAEAVLAGKPEKAETLMRGHLREVLRFIEQSTPKSRICSNEAASHQRLRATTVAVPLAAPLRHAAGAHWAASCEPSLK